MEPVGVTPQRNLGDLLCGLNFDQLDLNSKNTQIPEDTTITDNTTNTQTSIHTRVQHITEDDPENLEVVSPPRILLSSEFDSQNDSTPRSVLTSPDAREMETANLLLELGKPKNSTDTLQRIDAEVNNEEVVPIGGPPLDDIGNPVHEETDILSDNSDKMVD